MNKKIEYSLKKTELIGMEAPQDILELAVLTTHVKNERQDSVFLLAPPESAKTQLMLKYRKNKGIIVVRRFTAFGITKDVRSGKIELLYPKLKILGTLWVYDYNAVFTFKASTVDSTTEFVNAFTEEGLSAESVYWIEIDGLSGFEGLKGNIVSAITPFGFFNKNGKVKVSLLKGGFFSRFLVFSYSVPVSLRNEISLSISKGKYRRDEGFIDRIRLPLPEKRVDVGISEKYSQKIMSIASDIAEAYSSRLKPYILTGHRLHKSLIYLVKASALRDGRDKVVLGDVERIGYLSQWLNLELNPLKLDYPFSGRNNRKFGD
jgi:hypothetical protein